MKGVMLKWTWVVSNHRLLLMLILLTCICNDWSFITLICKYSKINVCHPEFFRTKVKWRVISNIATSVLLKLFKQSNTDLKQLNLLYLQAQNVAFKICIYNVGFIFKGQKRDRFLPLNIIINSLGSKITRICHIHKSESFECVICILASLAYSHSLMFAKDS